MNGHCRMLPEQKPMSPRRIRRRQRSAGRKVNGRLKRKQRRQKRQSSKLLKFCARIQLGIFINDFLLFPTAKMLPGLAESQNPSPLLLFWAPFFPVDWFCFRGLRIFSLVLASRVGGVHPGSTFPCTVVLLQFLSWLVSLRKFFEMCSVESDLYTTSFNWFSLMWVLI